MGEEHRLKSCLEWLENVLSSLSRAKEFTPGATTMFLILRLKWIALRQASVMLPFKNGANVKSLGKHHS